MHRERCKDGGSNVLIRISGPDARGTKRRTRTFFTSLNGRTTLSASACVVTHVVGGRRYLLTSAGVIAPFLCPIPSGASATTRSFIAGVEIDAWAEEYAPPRWCRVYPHNGASAAECVTVIEVPHFSRAVRVLTARLPISESRDVPYGALALLSIARGCRGVPAGRVVPTAAAVAEHADACLERGSPVLVTSSPYGLVSPRVFANSQTSGIVANYTRDRDLGHRRVAMLLVDARCLAGSEGGSVCVGGAGAHRGAWVGVVAPSLPPFLRPQRQARPERSGSTGRTLPLADSAPLIARAIDQLSAVIPLATFAPKLRRLLARKSGDAGVAAPSSSTAARDDTSVTTTTTRVVDTTSRRRRRIGRIAAAASGRNDGLLPFDESGDAAMHADVAARVAPSVVLIRVRGNDTWGSGVVLHTVNHTGSRRSRSSSRVSASVAYVVTCAHLFAGVRGGGRSDAADRCVADVLFTLRESRSGGLAVSTRRWRSARFLDVFSNALDLAVLAIELEEDCAEMAAVAAPFDFEYGEETAACTSPLVQRSNDEFRGGRGTTRCSKEDSLQQPKPAPAIVLGHGLFAARSLSPAAASSGSTLALASPSVTVGVVCNAAVRYHGAPMLLQTSAAVFGGNSGGALVDAASGCVVGIVRSNARRGVPDGTLIPRLNFAMHVAVLQPLVVSLRSGDKGAVTSALKELREWDGDAASLGDLWDLKSGEEEGGDGRGEVEGFGRGGPKFQAFLLQMKREEGPRAKL